MQTSFNSFDRTIEVGEEAFDVEVFLRITEWQEPMESAGRTVFMSGCEREIVKVEVDGREWDIADMYTFFGKETTDEALAEGT